MKAINFHEHTERDAHRLHPHGDKVKQVAVTHRLHPHGDKVKQVAVTHRLHPHGDTKSEKSSPRKSVAKAKSKRARSSAPVTTTAPVVGDTSPKI